MPETNIVHELAILNTIVILLNIELLFLVLHIHDENRVLLRTPSDVYACNHFQTCC